MPAAADPRGRALSDEIVAVLQKRIVAGEIPVGSWLRHSALAQELGVSRTPVREALRVLESCRIVEIERYRGARVTGPSPRDLRDLGDVRAELEGYAAALAAERIRDDQLARLHAAWRGYRDAIAGFVGKAGGARTRAAGARWERANEQFHTLVQEAAENPHLRASIADVHRRLPRNITYAALSGDSRLLLRNVEQHEAIAEAIARRDPDAAREAMRAHVRASTELVARWFETQAESQPPRR